MSFTPEHERRLFLLQEPGCSTSQPASTLLAVWVQNDFQGELRIVLCITRCMHEAQIHAKTFVHRSSCLAERCLISFCLHYVVASYLLMEGINNACSIDYPQDFVSWAESSAGGLLHRIRICQWWAKRWGSKCSWEYEEHNHRAKGHEVYGKAKTKEGNHRWGWPLIREGTTYCQSQGRWAMPLQSPGTRLLLSLQSSEILAHTTRLSVQHCYHQCFFICQKIIRTILARPCVILAALPFHVEHLVGKWAVLRRHDEW